jgi:hydrogenase-4 component B
MLPAGTMDALADLAQGFLGVHHAGHAVHYFAWVNLKGSVISIAIGAALYLTVVRRWMITDGVYVNRWPQWLDLEETLYRPLLLKVLPGIFGWICGVMDKIMDVAANLLTRIGAGVAGVLDILTDGIVVLPRKTVYRDSPQRGEL